MDDRGRGLRGAGARGGEDRAGDGEPGAGVLHQPRQARRRGGAGGRLCELRGRRGDGGGCRCGLGLAFSILDEWVFLLCRAARGGRPTGET